MKFRLCLAMLAVCLGAALRGHAAPDAAEPRVFTSSSFAAIREAAAGRPLVVAFWSITCAPCAEEIATLAQLRRAHPAVKMVLVSADGPAARAQVARFLGRYDLRGVELWQFGDETGERIRYSVDRGWRGELPRAYFFDAENKMDIQSGVPARDWLPNWFARASAAL